MAAAMHQVLSGAMIAGAGTSSAMAAPPRGMAMMPTPFALSQPHSVAGVGAMGEQPHLAAQTLGDASASVPSGGGSALGTAIPSSKVQPGQDGAIYELLAKALAQQQEQQQGVMPKPEPSATPAGPLQQLALAGPYASSASAGWAGYDTAAAAVPQYGHTSMGLCVGSMAPQAATANPTAGQPVGGGDAGAAASGRRGSLLGDAASLDSWSSKSRGLLESLSRRGSLAGGDALGIGAFNAMREAGLLGNVGNATDMGSASRRGSLMGNDALGIGAFNALRDAGRLPSTSTTASGIGPSVSRRGSLVGGDALGIGLFNAMREAGGFGGGAGSGNAGASRSRRNSLFNDKGEFDGMLLPFPGKLQGRRGSLASEDSVTPSSLLLQLGAAAWAKRPEAPADDSKNEGEGAEGADAAEGAAGAEGADAAEGGEGADGAVEQELAGGSGRATRARARRSSIVGPPLSPGEIDKVVGATLASANVVGSFEVDEKVSVVAPVAT